jgi:hypothetical protein
MMAAVQCDVILPAPKGKTLIFPKREAARACVPKSNKNCMSTAFRLSLLGLLVFQNASLIVVMVSDFDVALRRVTRACCRDTHAKETRNRFIHRARVCLLVN